MRKLKFLQKAGIVSFAGIAVVIVSLIVLSSCMPNYPKDKLPEHVKNVCKSEYNMDVNVTVVGSTMPGVR